MGERDSFPSNGHTCEGYLAGKGPAIVVIQEWWGLVPQIEGVVDRFAKEGFLAVAPHLPQVQALFAGLARQLMRGLE